MANLQPLAPAAGIVFNAPLTTAPPVHGLELRAEATPTASNVAALTTTFTPPAKCNGDSFTMLPAPSYQIWRHEPLPIPGPIIGDCYPPEFINGYTSVLGLYSSIAPLLSPLVCPLGWTTQTADSWSNGYIACCDSGFTLAPPRKTVDGNRPAYGGTCYSDFVLGTVVPVTVYNATALSTVIQFVATTTPAQAYGHPMDGFAADYTPASTASGASYTGGAAATVTGAAGSGSAASRYGGSGGELRSAAALAVLLAGGAVAFLLQG